MTNQKETISWQAPEFRLYEKNVGWYISAIAVAILIIGYFVIVAEDYFGAVTMFVATCVLLYFATHKPGLVTNELTRKGITTGDIHFPYTHLKHFWIVHDHKHQTVNFTTNTVINREIILQLDSQDPDAVREFLQRHLPEHHQTEATLPQRISHLIKF